MAALRQIRPNPNHRNKLKNPASGYILRKNL